MRYNLLIHTKGFYSLQGYTQLSASKSKVLGAPVKRGTSVEVYGYTFNVKSDLNRKQVQEIAEYVDTKMKDLAAKLKVSSTSRLAVMTAINIAEEFYRLRSEQNELSEAIEEKSAKLIQLVEDSMS